MSEHLRNWTDAEYFAEPAISQSTLRQYMQLGCEGLVTAYTKERAPTRSMCRGTLLHTHLLRPHIVDQSIAKAEDYDELKKPNSCELYKSGAKIEAWIAEIDKAGRIPVFPGDLDLANAQCAALRKIDILDRLLNLGDKALREQAIIAKYRGLAIKAKLDIAGKIETDHWMIDIKTTSSDNFDAIIKGNSYKLIDFGYDHQAAFYCWLLALALGIGDPTTISSGLAIVDDSPAPRTMLMRFHPAVIRARLEQIHAALDEIVNKLNPGQMLDESIAESPDKWQTWNGATVMELAMSDFGRPMLVGGILKQQ